MDVTTAFLHGSLKEDVRRMYTRCQPKVHTIDVNHLSHAYKLKKALYGLNHALRAWLSQLRSTSMSVKRIHSLSLWNHQYGSLPGIKLRILVLCELTGFLDVDQAGCQDTFKSTFGGTQFLGKKLVSCYSKKEDSTALSTVEVDFSLQELQRAAKSQ
ncbi:retrovirus-related pol polyprotein from transposon TNT 1-94 [Tanacetum coccineum]